jgi:2-polyprenyl-6-hydroxyphenyl methylase/3-demethylubiquinone-9 3-methyltransferase
MHKSTINKEEVEKFSKIADEWWDKNGKFKPLHKFNPIRLEYIKNNIYKHFNLKDSVKNINILDVGCGGGLLAEPISQMGANVTGIDASEKNIEVAKIHAQKSKLEINYQNIDLAKIASEKKKFDVILAMEIVEHVDNVDEFIKLLSESLKKNGILFIATINRTPESYLKAIIGAEYILRWLPRGTHDWKKFLKPSEIYEMSYENNLKLVESIGFDYNLIKDEWKLTKNLNVNFAMIFEKS